MERDINKMTLEEIEQLAKKIIEVSWANSMAYTKSVEKEDPIARIERIEKGMQEVDRMASLSLGRLQGRMLD